MDDPHTLPSQWITTGSLQLHYHQLGQGHPTLLLVHGSFLSSFSWRAVHKPLSHLGTVIAVDRPAFGLTERPLPDLYRYPQPYNPYTPDAQADLLIQLLDQLNVQQAVLIGHSAGGTLCLHAALRHPERVQAIILVDAMVYSGYAVTEFPSWLRPLLQAALLPGMLQMRLVVKLTLRRLLRSFWHDPSRLSKQSLDQQCQLLQVGPWTRALWLLFTSSHALPLASGLDQLTMPTLTITGAHDRIVPTTESHRLAQDLPAAQLVEIPDCNHLPHEEQPDLFVQAVANFVAQL